jgi:hypothetical protein
MGTGSIKETGLTRSSVKAPWKKLLTRRNKLNCLLLKVRAVLNRRLIEREP